MTDSPLSYGLPHNEWRPGQLDLYEKCRSSLNGDGGFIFACAPTGTGKSGVPTAIGRDSNVLVLVHTLGLLQQYQDIYGFSIVKGMQEYPCANPKKISDWRRHGLIPKASDCHLSNMLDCSYAKDCQYLVARDKVKNSRRAACTYRYATLSEEMQNREGCLVMDECHSSSDEILAFSEFKMLQDDVTKFDLEPFPLVGYGDGDGDMMSGDAKNEVRTWLAKSLVTTSEYDVLELMTPEGSRRRKMYKYLSTGMDLINSGHDLFLFVGDRVLEENLFSKRTERQLVIKPIEASVSSKKLYSNKKLVLLMSATIGNPEPLARELGIDTFTFYDYPHPVPRNKRPIYDLHVPRMTKANLDSTPGLYRTQAVIIATWIKSLDPKWRGIILTTSNFKVKLLRQNLSNILGDRILQPRGKTVSQRIEEFIGNDDHGLIAVDTIQGWGAGLDLSWDTARFSIVAGVPYSNPTDKYNCVRISRPGGKGYDLWSTFNTVPQACGRTSRGEFIDNDYLLNVSALADGSTTQPQAMTYYPSWFRESII